MTKLIKHNKKDFRFLTSIIALEKTKIFIKLYYFYITMMLIFNGNFKSIFSFIFILQQNNKNDFVKNWYWRKYVSFSVFLFYKK